MALSMCPPEAKAVNQLPPAFQMGANPIQGAPDPGGSSHLHLPSPEGAGLKHLNLGGLSNAGVSYSGLKVRREQSKRESYKRRQA